MIARLILEAAGQKGLTRASRLAKSKDVPAGGLTRIKAVSAISLLGPKAK